MQLPMLPSMSIMCCQGLLNSSRGANTLAFGPQTGQQQVSSHQLTSKQYPQALIPSGASCPAHKRSTQ